MNIVDPVKVGMCPKQLQRIGSHLRNAYVDKGKIAGSLTLIARRGEVCYLEAEGSMDLERDKPMSADAIFRIYSMSKPVTSVALMMLYEQGKFSLSDPVHRYIPQWRNLAVYKTGTYPLMATEPCRKPMTIRDLLMHTSGLTYSFLRATNVDRAYRELEVQHPRAGYTLQNMVDELAQLPLEFEPGSAWNYSVATDVLGYLVEVISGQSYPDYLQEHVFGPLGMVDTSFSIAPDKVDRFSSCYERDFNKQLVLQDDAGDSSYQDVSFYSGGGGLLSTVSDYYRFCQMLLNGGELDGQRLLGPRTVEFMTRNHLPGGQDMSAFARGSFSETSYEGVGFGLGFAQKVDPVSNGSLGSVGEYFWGGMASTLFWVDPAEELVMVFMTQLVPSGTFNFRGQLQSLIYPALVD
ncbi:serine hydrolase domain-containing protein [Candidatus Litorirhabdus singularis]|nr:serine hydrolase [Candidatus Litorirhabdus singularis]